MNDVQVDYFMAVAVNLSFTKTSEELYVSQPTISKQIKLLEKELGCSLFNRSNKGTSLTEAGKLYYEYFKNVKMMRRETELQVSNIKDVHKQPVNIGYLEGWDMGLFIPELIKRKKEECPNADVIPLCAGVKELTTLLLTGGIDIAITMKNMVEDLKEIEHIEIPSPDKILIYSENNRLADKEDLNPADFADELFLAPWNLEEKPIRRILMGYMEPYGFRPNINFVRNNETMISSVVNNLGVAVTDKWSWSRDLPGIRWIDLNVSDSICIATMKDYDNETVVKIRDILYEILEHID